MSTSTVIIWFLVFFFSSAAGAVLGSYALRYLINADWSNTRHNYELKRKPFFREIDHLSQEDMVYFSSEMLFHDEHGTTLGTIKIPEYHPHRVFHPFGTKDSSDFVPQTITIKEMPPQRVKITQDPLDSGKLYVKEFVQKSQNGSDFVPDE